MPAILQQGHGSRQGAAPEKDLHSRVSGRPSICVPLLRILHGEKGDDGTRQERERRGQPQYTRDETRSGVRCAPDDEDQ